MEDALNAPQQRMALLEQELVAQRATNAALQQQKAAMRWA